MSQAKHHRQQHDPNPTARRKRRRLVVAALAAALPALGMPLLTGSAADAALSPTVGATDPSTHFPSFYTDANGLSLQLCLDDPVLVNCLTTRAELLNAGDGGEGFYWEASADAATFSSIHALEAAYAGPGAGQETVFVRTRYIGDGEPDSEYTFTGPWGTDKCTTDATGTIPKSACTEDFPGAAAPGDFVSVTSSPKIGPFLTWSPISEAPPGFIGDPNVFHAVTGSPTGFNKFRVQGPGIDTSCGVIPNCAESDQFSLAGQLAPGAAASVSPASHDFGPVLAPGTATQTITYSSIGTTSVNVASASLSGDPAFTKTADTCTGATVASGSTCTVSVQYAPVKGVHAVGTLTFSDDGPGGSRAVALTGDGAQSAFAAMTPVAFGNEGIGTTPATRDVTVQNSGTAPLALSMTMSPANVGYSVAGTGVAPCSAGTSLAPGASCTARVSFRPTSVGVKNAALSLNAGDGAASTVPVSGTGQDVTRPTVIGRTPAAGTTAASRFGNVVTRFSESVVGVRSGTYHLTNLSSGRRMSAALTHISANRWVLNPSRTLPSATRIRVTLLGGASNIRDSHGVALTSQSWTFRTRR